MKKQFEAFFLFVFILSILSPPMAFGQNQAASPDENGPSITDMDPNAVADTNANLDKNLDPTKKVLIDANSLWKMLVTGNTDLLLETNQVFMAKKQVAISRGGLFPRLSLSTLFLGAGQPTFAFQGVAFLLPFLVPQNWGNYRKSQNLYAAEQMTYKIFAANDYASTISLVYTILNDCAILGVLQENVTSLQTIEKYTDRRVDIGISPPVELDRAKGETGSAKSQLALSAIALTKEISNLKYALGIDPQAVLTFNIAPVQPSAVEGLKTDDVTEKAFDIAYEKTQLEDLYKAAQKDKINATFSFLNGSSLTLPQTTNNGVAQSSLNFGQSSIGEGISIGFDYYPNIQQAELQKQRLLIRLGDLKRVLGSTLETALSQLGVALQEQDNARATEAHWKGVYLDILRQFRTGLATLVDVMLVVPSYRQAQMSRVEADTNVALVRLSLHRAMLTDQFASLPPVPGAEPPKKDKKSKKK